MHTIQLMNAEFNRNNKKLGRDMMYHTEKIKLLPREQYGNRKEHRAIIVLLNKRLTCDLLRQKNEAGAICSNNEKSCYNQVAHNIAALSMIFQGAPQNAVTSIF